jgi:hypothetical protein
VTALNPPSPYTRIKVKESLRGQGNPRPPVDYEGHAVVMIPGDPHIWDPSYGRNFNSLAEWEDASLESMYDKKSDISKNNERGADLVTSSDPAPTP